MIGINKWTEVRNCPECNSQCWACSALRYQVRKAGKCLTQFPGYKCKRGKAEKGKVCGTCDGSGTISFEVTRVT